MSEFFGLIREMPPPFNMVVLVVVIGCVTSLGLAVVYQIRLFADHEADRRLKRDLIDSGMPVDEATQLVRATPERAEEEVVV